MRLVSIFVCLSQSPLLSFLVPLLKIQIADRRPATPRREKFETSEDVLFEYMREMEDIESHRWVVPRSHFEYQTLPRTFGIDF